MYPKAKIGSSRRSPLWVKTRYFAAQSSMSALLPRADVRKEMSLRANSRQLEQLFLVRIFCRPIHIHSLELLCSGRDIITFTLSARALSKRQARYSIAEVFHFFLCHRCVAGVLPG